MRAAIEVRIKELKAAAAELESLLGDDTAAAVPDGHSVGPELADDHSRLRPYRRGSRGTKPTRDGRAPYGTNRQRILDEVVAHPGITAAEISERTGIKRTVISPTLYRLKQAGELEPYGEGVRIASEPGVLVG